MDVFEGVLQSAAVDLSVGEPEGFGGFLVLLVLEGTRHDLKGMFVGHFGRFGLGRGGFELGDAGFEGFDLGLKNFEHLGSLHLDLRFMQTLICLHVCIIQHTLKMYIGKTTYVDQFYISLHIVTLRLVVSGRAREGLGVGAGNGRRPSTAVDVRRT